jgi:hypothetical protein
MDKELNQKVGVFTEALPELGRLNPAGALPSTDSSLQRVQKLPASTVFAEIVEIAELKPYEHERLYHIFSKYYDGHSKEQFLQDLFEKNHIILLRDKKDRTLQGFSTLLNVEIETPSGRVRGIFSGDTILEKAYWGHPALGKAFLKYLWQEKVKRPWSPLYWFLISKGYKTYLLMANNFSTHYPRYEEKTPDSIKALMQTFYSKKYGNELLTDVFLIKPGTDSCRLKDRVAEITDVDRQNKRIYFFEQSNPNWKEGFELPCLAEMTLLMPFKYAIKKAIRRMR